MRPFMGYIQDEIVVTIEINDVFPATRAQFHKAVIKKKLCYYLKQQILLQNFFAKQKMSWAPITTM